MCRLKVAQKVASRQFETQLEAGDKYTLKTPDHIYRAIYVACVVW